MSKEAGKAMDRVTQILGAMMIILVAYVAITTKPPVGEAIARTFVPTQMPMLAIITLVGGTVGGYITFSGGHRLLDAGIYGKEHGQDHKFFFNRNGYCSREFLFLAVLGVVSKGMALDPASPPASAFKLGAGVLGYKLFGLVIWAAALTSVVGAAYTSVSFLTTFAKVIENNKNKWIIGFITVSTLIFITIGQPVTLLVIAGSLNGLILPITLGTMLIASVNKKVVGDYKHPKWLLVLGIL